MVSRPLSQDAVSIIAFADDYVALISTRSKTVNVEKTIGTYSDLSQAKINQV